MILKKNLIFSAVSILFMWIVWVLAYFILRNDYLLPSVGATFSALGRLLKEAAFWRAFAGTLLRTLWAFLLSLFLGVGLALLAGSWTWVRHFLSPIVSVLRTVPTMAIILVLLLWTNAAVAPVIVALLVLMPAFYAAALSALDGVRAEYGVLARAFRVNAKRKAFCMYLPLMAPDLLRQSGSVFSMGLKITISGEVLSQTFRSLGGMMQEAQIYVDMPRLLALTLLAVVLGFLLEIIGLIAYKLIVRWRA